MPLLTKEGFQKTGFVPMCLPKFFEFGVIETYVLMKLYAIGPSCLGIHVMAKNLIYKLTKGFKTLLKAVDTIGN